VSRRGPRRRSLGLQALGLVVLLAALVSAIAGLIPGSSARLDHAAVGWLLGGVAAELIACGGYALLFHGVFSHGRHRVGLLRAAEIGLGELGAFVVVPTGLGGPALRIWALLRSGMPFEVLMARTVTHAPIFNLPYIGAALVLGLGVLSGIGPGHAPTFVALAPLTLVAGAGVLALALTLLSRLPRPDPIPRWQRIGRDVVDAVPAGLAALPRRLRRNPALVVWATAYWAGDCAVLVLAFHAAHGSAPLGTIVLGYMLGQLGNALPLPGGIGGVEPIMLGVLSASGVNVGLGGAAILLYRLISLGLQALLGALASLALVRGLRGVRGEAAEA
jgi:uncharacterized membrane protein YbhN (UPF0104 family)